MLLTFEFIFYKNDSLSIDCLHSWCKNGTSFRETVSLPCYDPVCRDKPRSNFIQAPQVVWILSSNSLWEPAYIQGFSTRNPPFLHQRETIYNFWQGRLWVLHFVAEPKKDALPISFLMKSLSCFLLCVCRYCLLATGAGSAPPDRHYQHSSNIPIEPPSFSRSLPVYYLGFLFISL
jgi:hypothetical protein